MLHLVYSRVGSLQVNILSAYKIVGFTVVQYKFPFNLSGEKKLNQVNQWEKKLTCMISLSEMSFAAILLSIIAGNQVGKLQLELKDGKQ